MKTAPASAKISLVASYITAAILVFLPFHAFLTVWLSSAVGHYTLLRLWKEFLLAIIVLCSVYILLRERGTLKRLLSLRLVHFILAYIIVLAALTFVPLLRGEVSAKAAWYGLLSDSRFLIFFLAVMVIAAKSGWLRQRWLKLVLAPAILVAAFAVLQYLVLPYDFLRHFGYSTATIEPYETINQNLSHIRVFSTLRGPNPLGAYLIIPICVLGVMLFREKGQRLNKLLIGAGLLLALVFSFSRSAWIGALIGIFVIAWLLLKNPRYRRTIALVAAAILLVGAMLTLLFRDNTTFQNIVFHTDSKNSTPETSNEDHLNAFTQAGDDILQKPLGAGVGTAGPQSIYNHDKGRIAENYFLQIGQEAGIAGILLIILICVAMVTMLYRARDDSLALALLASFIGITFVNLLSHAWSDDTLAYIWWGLAAVALAPTFRKSSER